MADQPRPHRPPPLWMPHGSVRSIVLLALLLLTAVLLITGDGDISDRVPGELWTMDGVGVAFYFKKGEANGQ